MSTLRCSLLAVGQTLLLVIILIPPGCASMGDTAGMPFAKPSLASDGEQSSARQEGEYQTPVGRLKASRGFTKIEFTIGTEDGGTSSPDVIFGWVEPGVGLEVPQAFGVYPGKVSVEVPEVTLVHVKSSRKWVATNGALGIRGAQLGIGGIQGGKFVFVEGQTVKVIGGSSNPLLICGMPFADAVVAIRYGLPFENTRSAKREFVSQVVATPSLPPISADEYWAWAKKRDIAQGYRCFAYHYPDDSRASAAKERRVELDWAAARGEATREAFVRFQLTHPDSRYLHQIPEEYRKTNNGPRGVRKPQIPDPPLCGRAKEVLISTLAVRVPWDLPRLEAAVYLTELGEKRGVDFLVAALKDESGATRLGAATALGRSGERGAMDALCKMLGEDTGDDAEVVRALGAIDDPRASAALLAAGLMGSTRLGSHEIGEAMAGHSDPTARQLLHLGLQQPSPAMRERAASMLGGIRDPCSVDALLVAMKDGESEVRSSAAWALGKIGNPRALEALVAALWESSPSVRGTSAGALGDICDPWAVTPLISSAATGRTEAILSLGKIRDLRAIPQLAICLTSKYDRRYAATALGQCGDRRGIDALVEDLKAQDPDTRRDAASALGEIGDRRVVEPLLKALDDPASSVRTLPVPRALGEIGDPRAVPGLLAYLTGPVPPESAGESDYIPRDWSYTRRYAVEALGKIGDPRAARTLLKCVPWCEERSLRGVVEALAKVCQRDDAALMEALGDPDHRRRQIAAEALAIIAECRRIMPLTQSVSSGPEDRSGVSDTLTKALGDKDDCVRVHVAAAVIRNLRRHQAASGSASKTSGDPTTVANPIPGTRP